LMITYRIISRNTSQSKEHPEHGRRRFNPDNEEGRKEIFTRSLAKWQRCFSKGDPIRLHGTAKKGIITKIFTDVAQVTWINKRPHFIEILMDTGDAYIANPSQLTKVNSK
jgi:hypothetical protein